MSAAAPSSALLNRLLPPSLFGFWARELGTTLSRDQILARVTDRKVEASHTVTLTLKPNRRFSGFKAGQHVTVTMDINGRKVSRSYSLSDCPRKDGLLRITVRQHPEGLVSNAIARDLEPGDIVQLSPPFGDMVLPSPLPEKILLLAAGTGITPLMAMIRQIASQPGINPTQRVTLLYWARTREDVCFYQELKALAAKGQFLSLHLMLTRESRRLPGERSDHINEDLLAELVPDFDAHHVFACGPAGFVETARNLARGISSPFKGEAFTLPTAAGEAAKQVTVTLRESGKSLQLSTGQTLLEALEQAGEKPAYGCRMGICHTCACGKSEGKTVDVLSGESSAEPNQNIRLCVTRPQSDLVIDL